MRIEFYRQKNALNCTKAIIREPSEIELREELIKKLEQKAGRIEIASDAQKMKKYLEEKIAREGSRFTKFDHVPSDDEAKRYMTRNIAVDIAQVLKDISEGFDLKLNFDREIDNFSEIEISQKLYELSEKFKKSGKKQLIFNEICAIFVNYLNIFDFNLKEIEEERIEKEEKQGSFLNGLFVTFE